MIQFGWIVDNVSKIMRWHILFVETLAKGLAEDDDTPPDRIEVNVPASRSVGSAVS